MRIDDVATELVVFVGYFIMTLGGRFAGHGPWAHGCGSCQICLAAEHGTYGSSFNISCTNKIQIEIIQLLGP